MRIIDSSKMQEEEDQSRQDQNGRKRLPKMEEWRQQRDRCADVPIPAESNIRDEEHRKVNAASTDSPSKFDGMAG